MGLKVFLGLRVWQEIEARLETLVPEEPQAQQGQQDHQAPRGRMVSQRSSLMYSPMEALSKERQEG